MRRDPGPERLRQVDARPAALDAAPPRRRQREGVRARRLHRGPDGAEARQPRLGRGLVLQEDVGGREPALRRPLLRHGPEGDAPPDPGDPRSRRLPARPPHRADGEPLTRDAAEGGARAGAPDVTRAAPARRADDRSRSPLEARGAEVHPRGAGEARRDDPALHARPRRGRGARGPDRHPRSRRAAVARARRRPEAPLRRRDARAGVLLRHRPDVRGRGRRGRRRGPGGVRR